MAVPVSLRSKVIGSRILGIAGLLLFSGLLGGMAATPDNVTDAFDRLVIRTASGAHEFRVEIADAPRERARGLMYRRTLEPDRGMLFDFERPRPISMWMKNTYIPLDMLFIGDGGAITHIAERTVPESETPIPSQGPARAVLELPGGTAARLGIRTGDRVVHSLFGAAGG